MPFWAIQAAGLEGGQEPLASVEALAQANLEALTQRGLAQPRWIGGYSFGGLVAFEMARQLAQQGTPPERVVIIDAPAPLERTSVLESRSEEHTSELQSLMRISYAVFCLKQKKTSKLHDQKHTRL